MSRRRPFEDYRTTTKYERIVERRKLAEIQRTNRFSKWLLWMFKMQHGECFYCDDFIDLNVRQSYHIDHRIAVYHGGKSDYSNLCLACPSCNMYKSTDQLIRNKTCLNKMNKNKRTKVLYF